jgi:hypothetical protein
MDINNLKKAIEDGYVFTEIKDSSGKTVIVGALATSDMPSEVITESQEGVYALFDFLMWVINYDGPEKGVYALFDFLMWAINYDGPQEDFYPMFKERVSFIMLSLTDFMKQVD